MAKQNIINKYAYNRNTLHTSIPQSETQIYRSYRGYGY